MFAGQTAVVSSGCGRREVERRLVHVVEVVGEDGQRHLRDHLGDDAVVEARLADLGEVLVADLAAGLVHLASEANEDVGLRVDRGPVASVADLVAGQAEQFADGGVSGQAVFASVGLADRQGELLADLVGDLAVRQRPV